MTHAIVTGATGFIGTHLVAELLQSGARVTALCLENDPHINRLPPRADIAYAMERLPNADIFYHLAWESASGPGRADAFIQSKSAVLALEALSHAHRLGCARFIALGTVYERLAAQVTQAGRFGGADFYILAKRYAHDMAGQLAHKLGIDFVWCEICHPIGRLVKEDQMLASVVSGLLNGASPPLGPALSGYDIVAVGDVALGLRLLGEAARLSRREYYIGSGAPGPLRAWLEEARSVLGADTALGIGQRPDDGLRFNESWFDITPLTADTGYAPRVPFAAAVAEMANWLRESKAAASPDAPRP